MRPIFWRCQQLLAYTCWHAQILCRNQGGDPGCGRERFAQSGFERATIRAIAADANIDPSMVMRYFGNKDQLFAAAADFDLDFPDIAGIDPDQMGARMVAHFMNRWERDEALIVLLRSSTTNADAAARMQAIFAAQLLPAIAKVNAVDPARSAGPHRVADARARAMPLRAAAAARRRHAPRRGRVVARTHRSAVPVLSCARQWRDAIGRAAHRSRTGRGLGGAAHGHARPCGQRRVDGADRGHGRGVPVLRARTVAVRNDAGVDAGRSDEPRHGRRAPDRCPANTTSHTRRCKPLCRNRLS